MIRILEAFGTWHPEYRPRLKLCRHDDKVILHTARSTTNLPEISSCQSLRFQGAHLAQSATTYHLHASCFLPTRGHQDAPYNCISSCIWLYVGISTYTHQCKLAGLLNLHAYALPVMADASYDLHFRDASSTAPSLSKLPSSWYLSSAVFGHSVMIQSCSYLFMIPAYM